MHPLGTATRAFATFHRRLAAIRVLGMVPSHVLIIPLLGAFSAVFGYEAYASSRDSPSPVPVALERIFSPRALGNRHVEVTGLLFPETHLAYPPERKGIPRPSRYVYVAMLGPEDRILLVRFAGDLGHGAPRLATISGLLRPPENSLARAMDAKGWKLGTASVEPRYVLIAQMTPRPVWLSAGLSLALGIPAVGLLGAALLTIRQSKSPARTLGGDTPNAHGRSSP